MLATIRETLAATTVTKTFWKNKNVEENLYLYYQVSCLNTIRQLELALSR